MAINVLMVFFMNGDAHSIKKWGWVYCLICYGGPLIIALVCLQLRAPNKTLVYGSAGVSDLLVFPSRGAIADQTTAVVLDHE